METGRAPIFAAGKLQNQRLRVAMKLRQSVQHQFTPRAESVYTAMQTDDVLI